MCWSLRFALCGPERIRNKVQTGLVQLWSVCADYCIATSFLIVKMLLCCQWEKGFCVCWGVIIEMLRLARMEIG